MWRSRMRTGTFFYNTNVIYKNVKREKSRRTTAFPLKMMYRKRGGRSMGSVPEDLQRVVQNTKAVGVVVGWPLDLEGNEGSQCQKTHQFVRSLIFRGTLSIPVTYWDERYSTQNAEENWGSGRGIDAFAALEILQDYLDEMNEEDEDY